MPSDNQPSSPVANNLPTFLASLGMCAGFFMPWLSLFGGVGLSGYTLGRAASEMGGETAIVWVVLVLAIVSVVTHVTRPNKPLNVVAGLAPFGLLIFYVSKAGGELFQALGAGAWLTLVCGAVLVFMPVRTKSE